MMNPQGRQSSKRGRGRVPCIGRSIVKKYHETLKPNKGNKKLYKESDAEKAPSKTSPKVKFEPIGAGGNGDEHQKGL